MSITYMAHIKKQVMDIDVKLIPENEIAEAYYVINLIGGGNYITIFPSLEQLEILKQKIEEVLKNETNV